MAALAAWPVAAAGLDLEQVQVTSLSGVWRLNAEASQNPNGAEKPASCARAGRGGRGGRGGGGGGGGGDVGGALGAEETARFCAMLNYLYEAPAMMAVRATEADFMMILDPATNFGYAHKTDNKGQPMITPAGPGEAKVKWDKTKMVREIETPDTLKIVEEYTLSSDGQQLIVEIESSSRMVRVPNPEIRRVYDRQPQGGGQ
jgi:hypothetical protein